MFISLTHRNLVTRIIASPFGLCMTLQKFKGGQIFGSCQGWGRGAEVVVMELCYCGFISFR